ncbi:MAG: patatin family protein [Leptospirales bacterium]|nr:patatin family protein [Leptospirales bacterium]
MNFLKRLFKKQEPPRKVLVIEGGGMRGIFLAGVLQAFTDRAYFPFKLIIGTSAGALVGCAYAARQIHIARDALFGKLSTGRFIQVSNILKSERHVIDLDWMIDAVVAGPEPLNVAALKKSSPVIITATNCPHDRAPETVYLNSQKDDIFQSLKATAALPFLYKGFVKYKDYLMLDGGITDPIPFYKALKAGYKDKDILVLTTRPQGYRKKQDSFLIRALYGHYYKEPELRYLVESMDNLYKKYNGILDDLENFHKDIEVIYPPADFSVEKLTTDTKKLLEGFQQGVQAGNAYMQRVKNS